MRSLLSLGVLSFIVLAAQADPILFNNGVPDGSNAHASQLDTIYPFQAQAADDFTLAAGGTLTAAEWFGTWWGPGPPGNATFFNIILYADAGGQPTGAGMTDPTPTALKLWHIPVAQVHETPYVPVPGYYSYTADFSTDPFTVTPGTRYWIVFQSVNTFPPQWGTAVANRTNGTEVQGFPIIGIPYWTPKNMELAFNLHGVPEPASVLLISLAVLLLRRR